MKTRDNQIQENKSQSVANRVPGKHNNNEPTFQLVDNRPEIVAQRKLQEMANNSLETKQIAQLKPIIQLGGGHESEEDEGPGNDLPERRSQLGHKIVTLKYKIAHSNNDDEKNVLNGLLSQFKVKLDEVNNQIKERREASQ